MKKNLLFTIVAIVLAIATLTVGLLLIFKNKGDTCISIGSSKALAGDTVEIPISIKKNSGIWGGQVIIDYDSDNLSFVSMSNGTVFEECEANDTGECVALLVTQSTLENSKKNGVIATIKFKVKASSKKGEQAIKFNSETNFCNVDEEMIKPELINGSITVK